MIKVHGIKNCDTVKKSIKWLEQHQLKYEFRDVREVPLSKAEVEQWLADIPADQLVNKRSTSWRQLDESQRDLSNQSLVCQLIVEQPTLFKRPLVQAKGEARVGFNAQQWEAWLG